MRPVARYLPAVAGFTVLLSSSFCSWVMAAEPGDFVPGGEVTSAYCERTRNDKPETHAGTDIGVKGADGKWKSGGDVKAGVTGTVVKVYKFDGKHAGSGAANSDWLKNFNTVVIKGSDGKFYVYAHMGSISVNEGDAVTPTSTIGTLGGLGANCANTFGPHLHLEKRDDSDGDGTWESADEDLVCSGSKTKASDPMTTNEGNKSAKVESSGGSPAMEYSVTNDCSSVGPIDYLRVSYGSELPYIASPISGWEVEPWMDSPAAVVWRSTAPVYDIQPCQTAMGFLVQSPARLGQVSFFVDNDDAGHGGGLGREPVTITGFAADPAALDDFACYGIRSVTNRCADDPQQACRVDADCAAAGLVGPCLDIPTGLQVDLVDQFGAERVDVKKPAELCLPTEKNGVVVINGIVHLERYRIAPVKGAPAHVRRTLLLHDQFGDHLLTTVKTESLLVPTAKSLAGPVGPPPPGLDHYKCYKAKAVKYRCTDDPTRQCRSDAECQPGAGLCDTGLALGLVVSASNQFEARDFGVLKPAGVCAPADKNGSGIANPSDHLVVYKVKAARGEPKHVPVSGVHLFNQFGPELASTVKERVLLVPALKELR